MPDSGPGRKITAAAGFRRAPRGIPGYTDRTPLEAPLSPRAVLPTEHRMNLAFPRRTGPPPRRALHLLPRLAAAALLLALGGGAALSCSVHRSSGEPRGLVLIVVDTLRGDRLGCAGYGAAVTPTLDSLAAAGTMFTDAMTPAPVTLPAMSSILTGRLPFHHGVRDNDAFVLAPDRITLAERFRERRWRTGAVVGSAVLAADRGLNQGFETYDDEFGGEYPVYDPSLSGMEGRLAATRRRADAVTDHALQVLDEMDRAPFFLLVHYFDVHMYYDPPPAFAALHPGRPYDGEVSFVDAQIGRLLREVRRHHDVLTVVTADHGESQNEHGEPQHGFLLYQSTLHVPLIVSGPEVPPGVRREDPVSLVDLEPTLARVFDLPGNGPSPDGRALVWNRPEVEPRTLYAETFRTLVSYNWSELRAARRGPLKLIRGPHDEVYDLAADGREQHDLVDSVDVPRLSEFLEDIAHSDPPESVLAAARPAMSGQRRELLQSLGYVGAMSAETTRPRVHPDPRQMLPGWLAEQWAKDAVRHAGVFLARGDTARATDLLDSALVVNPRLVPARVIRGQLRAASGERAAARRDLEAALAADPTEVHALATLARLAGAESREREAHALWKRVYAADETDRDALVHLAEWDIHHGRPEHALPYLRRLVNQDPEDAAARFDLGLAAHRTGRGEEARENFESYLELDPKGPAADEVRKLLED